MRERTETRKAREGKEAEEGPIPLSCPDHRSFPVSVLVWFLSRFGPRFGPGQVGILSLFRSWSGSGLFLVRSGSGPGPDPVWSGSGLAPYIYRFRIRVWSFPEWFPFLPWYGFRSRYRFGLVPVTEGPTSPHQNEGTGFKRFRFGQGRQEGGQGAAPSDLLSGGPFQSDLLTRRIC